MADLDLDAIRAALGALKPETDARVVRPLHEQVAALLRFATDPGLRPRRTIPIAWNDTDLLVCDVVAKLVAEVDRLTAENEALRETLVEVAGGIGWRERDVWGRVIGQGTVWIELSEDADRVVREVLGLPAREGSDG